MFQHDTASVTEWSFMQRHEYRCRHYLLHATITVVLHLTNVYMYWLYTPSLTLHIILFLYPHIFMLHVSQLIFNVPNCKRQRSNLPIGRELMDNKKERTTTVTFGFQKLSVGRRWQVV